MAERKRVAELKAMALLVGTRDAIVAASGIPVKIVSAAGTGT